MKKMKKVIAMVIAMIMVLGMSTAVMGQTVNSEKGGNATITIDNAAKGEDYAVYKLFDASVTGIEDGSIRYTGTIPASLAAYFEADTEGNITATAAAGSNGELSAEAIAALTEWAKTAEAAATAKSDGSELVFSNLEYGYYVVTTSQGNTAITVTSTNPNAEVYDKNSTEPSAAKAVNDDNVDIGQTVTYTLRFDTATWLVDKDGVSKQVVKYEISDTLPAFLSDVTVTEVTIGGTEYTVNDEVPQFADKKIVIDWVDGSGNSVYGNGDVIVITYTATVTDAAKINADNENVVTLQPYVIDEPGDDTPDPWDKKWEDEAVIRTYAAALQKVDENKAPLAGAKFQANGLTVTGAAGEYTVVSYDPESTTPGTEMECDSEGQLVILGLSTDSKLTVTESEAPAGYNKLGAAEAVTMVPAQISEEVTKTDLRIYYDANGNVTDEITNTYYDKTTYNVDLLKTAVVVVNEKGVLLPSTGGMGTTMIYIIGAILVVGAGVVLITRRRMVNE